MNQTTARAAATDAIEDQFVPTLIVTAERLVQCNTAAEVLFGWSRADVLDHDAADVLAPADQAPCWRRTLDAAAAGTLARTEMIAHNAGRRRFTVTLTFSVLAGAPPATLMVCIIAARALPLAPSVGYSDDLNYSVSIEPKRIGELVIRPIGTSGAGETRRCHEVLHRRVLPCGGCPVFMQGERPTPAILPAIDGAAGSLRLVYVSEITKDVAQVTSRQVSSELLDRMNQERIADLVRRARLSSREHEVLDQLLLGRTYREIARALKITVRTVRFHLQNVLGKLGAESRADLFRLFI